MSLDPIATASLYYREESKDPRPHSNSLGCKTLLYTLDPIATVWAVRPYYTQSKTLDPIATAWGCKIL